jgi:hypothetical protein
MRRFAVALALIFAGALLPGCKDDAYCFEIEDNYVGVSCDTASDCPNCDDYCEDHDGLATGDAACNGQCLCPCEFCYEGYEPP